MQIYFFSAGLESDELSELENSIRQRLPALRKLAKLDEASQELPDQSKKQDPERIYIIFPVLTAPSSIDSMVSIAEQNHQLFFIFVSRDITAGDYKRLVRGGNADWASLQGAAQEISDIIFRRVPTDTVAVSSRGAKPAIAAFVASSGGVGNATLALEAATQLKLDKKTRNVRICLLDLDLQSSHICDYLDIEARLQLQEITERPERLDAQLFSLFVSSHSSGLDILAAPRDRRNPLNLDLRALEALFGMIATRYDLVVIDLPSAWFPWTETVLSVSDLVVVTGFNTVPGLRQVAGTLQAVREMERIPRSVRLVLSGAFSTSE
jgi:pilus assembly protein CpaE